MFKEVLSTLTSSVIDSVKTTAKDYLTPKSMLGDGFSQVAQRGIASISHRSPMLGDLAENIIKNFQLENLRREKIKDFVKSDKASALKEDIAKNIGTQDSKKIDAEMLKILDKITKSIDQEGLETAKRSELFKKYSRHFEDAKSEKNTPPADTPPQTAPSETGDSLARIEKNTQRTVNVLEEIAVSKSIDDNQSSGSFQNTAGNIAGQFLSKVFDESFIDDLVGKTKGIFQPKSTTVPEVAPTKTEKIKPKSRVKGAKPIDVASVLGDLSLDLMPQSKSSEGAKENNSRQDKRAGISAATEINQLEELRKISDLNKKLLEKENSSGGDGDGDGMLGDLTAMIVGRLLPSLGGMVGAAGSALASVGAAALPALAVGAAGAAGYMVGDKIINPLIDKGISAMTGQETSLGGWIYDQFNEPTLMTENKISPAPINTAAVQKASEAKDAKEKTQSQSSAPVVINTTNQQSGGDSNIAIATSIRNQDSTFQRVQMQDFWPRTA